MKFWKAVFIGLVVVPIVVIVIVLGAMAIAGLFI